MFIYIYDYKYMIINIWLYLSDYIYIVCVYIYLHVLPFMTFHAHLRWFCCTQPVASSGHFSSGFPPHLRCSLCFHCNDIIHELGIPFLSNRFWTMLNCKIVGSGWLARPKISCAGPPRSTDPTNMIGYKSYIPLIPGISIPLCHALICILIKLLALPICSLHLGNSNSWSNWNLTHCLTAGHYNYTKELVPPFAMPLGVPKRTGWPGWRDPKVRVHGTEITSYNIDIIDS